MHVKETKDHAAFQFVFATVSDHVVTNSALYTHWLTERAGYEGTLYK